MIWLYIQIKSKPWSIKCVLVQNVLWITQGIAFKKFTNEHIILQRAR